jgi:hypothetical protein
MAHVVVSSSISKRSLIIRAHLTQALMEDIGKSFTLPTGAERDEVSMTSFTHALRNVLGDWDFRWFCIDLSSTIAFITFSNAANPRTLSHSGATVQIAKSDAAPFTITVQEADVIKPDRRDKTFVLDTLIK